MNSEQELKLLTTINEYKQYIFHEHESEVFQCLWSRLLLEEKAIGLFWVGNVHYKSVIKGSLLEAFPNLEPIFGECFNLQDDSWHIFHDVLAAFEVEFHKCDLIEKGSIYGRSFGEDEANNDYSDDGNQYYFPNSYTAFIKFDNRQSEELYENINTYMPPCEMDVENRALFYKGFKYAYDKYYEEEIKRLKNL